MSAFAPDPAAAEPAAEEEEPPVEEDPFAEDELEEDTEATRVLNLDELQFGPNYKRD